MGLFNSVVIILLMSQCLINSQLDVAKWYEKVGQLPPYFCQYPKKHFFLYVDSVYSLAFRYSGKESRGQGGNMFVFSVKIFVTKKGEKKEKNRTFSNLLRQSICFSKQCASVQVLAHVLTQQYSNRHLLRNICQLHVLRDF